MDTLIQHQRKRLDDFLKENMTNISKAIIDKFLTVKKNKGNLNEISYNNLVLTIKQTFISKKGKTNCDNNSLKTTTLNEKIEKNNFEDSTPKNQNENNSNNFSSNKNLLIDSNYLIETPSTTPSRKGSPIFTEKKNVLLSSKIEDIINDGYEIYCQKFEINEDLNINEYIENGKSSNFDHLFKDWNPNNGWNDKDDDFEKNDPKKISDESLFLLDYLPF